MVPSPRRLPHTISPVEEHGFELAVPPRTVTAGGQLLLAMVHRLVIDHGGMIAACDTDGAHIVSTAEGGTVYVESRSADFYRGGPAEPVHALSSAEVAEIAGSSRSTRSTVGFCRARRFD
jgi:hypothetical protein